MSDLFVGRAAILTDAGFAAAVDSLGVDAAALWALVAVETGGFGFLPDRRPQILFERHIFSRRTGNRYDAAHPDISSPTPGGYHGGAAEYERLQAAMNLDRIAALESASWGLPQVMGFHAVALGYPGAEGMVAAFRDGEDAQLDGAVRFIRADAALLAAFRKRDWAGVALRYNDKDYRRNAYDTKLSQRYAKFRDGGAPDMKLRAAQARLTFLGYDPKGVDGVYGPGAKAALTAFQEREGLAVTGTLDADTSARLSQRAGV